jgi:hypothetical protein
MKRTQHGEGVVGRIEYETVFASLGAGVTMGLLEVIASVASGESALLPLRSAASVVLRDHAFGPNAALIALIGTIVHFSIAIMFGFAYGVFSSQLSWAKRVRGPLQALLGVGFGTAVWLINFQFIGRLFYPWMFEHSQVAQWLIHAVGFGLPLGLLLAEQEPPLRIGEKPER